MEVAAFYCSVGQLQLKLCRVWEYEFFFFGLWTCIALDGYIHMQFLSYNYHASKLNVLYSYNYSPSNSTDFATVLHLQNWPKRNTKSMRREFFHTRNTVQDRKTSLTCLIPANPDWHWARPLPMAISAAVYRKLAHLAHLLLQPLCSLLLRTSHSTQNN